VKAALMARAKCTPSTSHPRINNGYLTDERRRADPNLRIMV